MVKIAVDCKRGQIGLVSLVVYIVVINGICTRSSLFHPVRAFQVPMVLPLLDLAIYLLIGRARRRSLNSID